LIFDLGQSFLIYDNAYGFGLAMFVVIALLFSGLDLHIKNHLLVDFVLETLEGQLLLYLE
jgi:hypothetical protein